MDRYVHVVGELWDQMREALAAKDARIASLEDSLAAAMEQTIELAAQRDKHCSERDEARRVAVWAARHHASYHADKPIGHVNYWINWDKGLQDEEECDGTDASIYAALRQASGEGE